MYFFSFHPDIENIGDHSKYSKGWSVKMFDSLYRLAEACTRQLNAPAVWNYGIRKLDNFVYSDFLVVDVDDDSKLSLAAAMDKYARYQHFIGTTKSHLLLKGGKRSERYRIFLPIERRCKSVADYKVLNAIEAARCGGDLQASSPAQQFMPLTKIVSLQEVGRQMPYQAIQEQRPKEKLTTRSVAFKQVPLYVENWLKGNVAPGERNLHCFKAACALLKRGFTAEESFNLIYNSALPIGKSEAIEREVRSAVRSASKRL